MSQIVFPTYWETPKMLGEIMDKDHAICQSQNLLKAATVKDYSHSKNVNKIFWHRPWLYAPNKRINQMTRTISKTEFKSEVIDNMSLSLVQFRIEWSGACQIISPIYEELASSYKGQAKFFTVDVEAETGIDHEYGITELPTILFFRSGKIIDHVTGLIPKNVMISKIENALTKDLN